MSRRRNIFSLSALTALGLALLPGGAFAQQEQHVSFKASAANSKYTQTLNLDVGDVPNHIVRAFELHRTFPDNQPVINGIKLAELWSRGITDLTDGNGSVTQYTTYVMENGDKFFDRKVGIVGSASGMNTVTQVGLITSGTGKFVEMKGITRASARFDLKGFNEGENDIDYSIGK